MNKRRSVVLLAVGILYATSATLQGAPAGVISPYDDAPTPVRHAVHRLSDFTGFAVGKASGAELAVRIELNATQNPKLGAQGYTIRSTGGGGIAIAGKTDEGAANGAS